MTRMKKLMLSALVLFVAFAGYAQTAPAPAAGEQSEWLPSFTSIAVSGPFDITFIAVPDTEAPRLVYDTKGSYTTKFKAEVKDKVLRINEREDSRRSERTSVKLYYNAAVQSISISDAVATFEKPITGVMFDLVVGGRAAVTAELDVQDLLMELSGNSTAHLSGKVRFLQLAVSSGRVDGAALAVMSAMANISTGGSATLNVTERLEASTTTKGKLSYTGSPQIVRGAVKFLGGEITRVE